MPTRVLNNHVKFHSDLSSIYGDIALRAIGGKGQWTYGRTDGQPESMMLSTYYR